MAIKQEKINIIATFLLKIEEIFSDGSSEDYRRYAQMGLRLDPNHAFFLQRNQEPKLIVQTKPQCDQGYIIQSYSDLMWIIPTIRTMSPHKILASSLNPRLDQRRLRLMRILNPISISKKCRQCQDWVVQKQFFSRHMINTTLVTIKQNQSLKNQELSIRKILICVKYRFLNSFI